MTSPNAKPRASCSAARRRKAKSGAGKMLRTAGRRLVRRLGHEPGTCRSRGPNRRRHEAAVALRVAKTAGSLGGERAGIWGIRGHLKGHETGQVSPLARAASGEGRGAPPPTPTGTGCRPLGLGAGHQRPALTARRSPAPIVMLVAGHGASGRRVRPRVLPRPGHGALPSTPARGHAAQPGAGRPLRHSRAGARGALRANARSAAGGGAPGGGCGERGVLRA